MCALVTGVQTCALPISHEINMTTNQRRKRVSMSVSCYVDDKMLRSSFYCNHVRKGWKETYSYKINTVTNSNSTRCFPTAYLVIPVSGPRSEESRVGKGVSVRVALGGRRTIKKTK